MRLCHFQDTTNISESVNETLKFLANIYVSNIQSFYDEVVPGITLSDPVLMLIKLIASKKPNSLIQAMMMSDKVLWS